MGWTQAPLSPNPPGKDLSGQTGIVTGGNAGLGFETSRQLLTLGVKKLILACRNASKGEAARQLLLGDPDVMKRSDKPLIKVMLLDMGAFSSVLAFADAVMEEVNALDILLLNAGMASIKHELSPDRHEKVMQVNYLSNVLLALKLLPLLESTSSLQGTPTRMSWVGSRDYLSHSLGSNPLPANQGNLTHFDDPTNFRIRTRYSDAKMMCIMFLRELAARVPREKVIINSMCPGQVQTNFWDALPFYVRVPIKLIMHMRGRTLEQGGWVIAYATVFVGEESHGQFLLDKDIVPWVLCPLAVGD